jgi:3-dehydroquinate dehydratase type II
MTEKTMKLYIINGPNLNMLGIREPAHYGRTDYKSLVEMIRAHAERLGIETVFYQSNHEGDLVDKIQEAYFEGANGIVINPGAYTHTSIALLDAVKSTSLPTVEVHISKVEEREEYRQISYIREACCATITGHGVAGYTEAVELLAERLKNES